MKKTKITALLLSLAMLSSAAMPGTLAIESAADGSAEYECGFDYEHTHDEGCYDAELTCTEEESAGHTHGEDCYTIETVLNCDLTEEPHECTDECYEQIIAEEPSCGNESEEHEHNDDCYAVEEVQVCEPVPHEHDDGCYIKEKIQTCEEPETEGHTHGDGCYSEPVLVCTTEEHTHDESCLPEPEVCDSCGMEVDSCICCEFCDGTTDVHHETCIENCSCGTVDGVHLEGCVFWVEEDLTADNAEIVEDEYIVETVDTEISDENGAIIVTGELPNDGFLVVDEVSKDQIARLEELKQSGGMINTFAFTEEETEKIEMWSGYYDIKVYDGADNEWQPEDTLTITLEGIYTEDYPTELETIEVYHYLDTPEAILSAMEAFDAGEIEMGYYYEEGLTELFPSETAAAWEALEMEDTICYTVLSEERGEVVCNDDGSISFDTNGFSIYQVSGFGVDIDKTQTIQNGATVNMYRNDEKYFVWQWNEPNEDILDAYQGTWTVTSGEDNVRFEVYNSVKGGYWDPNVDGTVDDYRFAYLWLKVTALKPGNATLQFKYRDSENTIKTETFNINILETTDLLYLDDQIAENGCLVPVFTDSRNTTGIEFEWSRDDNVIIYEEALHTPYAVIKGAINVSMDRGGVDNEDRKMTTYTVVAKNDEGEIARASFEVPYGNEVINGGFEFPIAQAENTGFANGTQGLFWATTMPADGTGTLAWDVEYLSKEYDSSENSFIDVFGIVMPKDSNVTPDGTRASVQADFDLPDGNQLAEINGSNPGALHQDVLTYPGAEMYWSLAHRARNYSGNYTEGPANYWNINAIDTMYVIIAPTAQVAHIKTQDQLNDLIIAAGDTTDGTQITKTVDGYSITYSIRKIQGDHTQWRYYDNSQKPYVVGEGEYLTRYFFASGETFYDKNHENNNVTGTVGNLIDKVSFSNELPWRIEYYIDEVLQEDLTQSGTEPLERDGKCILDEEAKWLQEIRFAEVTHTKSTINDASVGIVTKLETIYSGHNILKIYFESYGITITKEVIVSNYSELSTDEKEKVEGVLNGYTFEFDLYEEGETVVATARVKIDSKTFLGTAAFINREGKKFLPDQEKSYIIKEKQPLSDIGGVLKLTVKALDSRTLHGSLIYTHIATNTYEMIQHGNLKISKAISGAPYSEDETFIVRVKGTNFEMDITLKNGETKTIESLPFGEYTVEEVTTWSWRYKDSYTPSDRKAVLDINNLEETITVTNTMNPDADKWLSGDCYADNWFGGINGTIDKNRIKYD